MESPQGCRSLEGQECEDQSLMQPEREVGTLGHLTRKGAHLGDLDVKSSYVTPSFMSVRADSLLVEQGRLCIPWECLQS